jgi:hypothetical protein
MPTHKNTPGQPIGTRSTSSVSSPITSGLETDISKQIGLLSSKVKGFEVKMKTIFDDNFKSFKEDFDKTFEEITRKINDRLNTLESRVLEIESGTYKKDIDDRLSVITDSIKDCCTDTSKCLSSIDTLVESELLNRVTELERISYSNGLIINNVPRLSNESLKDIITKISHSINFKLDFSKIIDIFRSKNGTIILKFANINTRNIFFSLYFKKKNLCLADIGINDVKRIYISECLSPYVRSLQRITIKMKEDKWIFKCFTYNGALFIVKNEGDNPIRIISKHQLINSNPDRRQSLHHLANGTGQQLP